MKKREEKEEEEEAHDLTNVNVFNTFSLSFHRITPTIFWRFFIVFASLDCFLSQ